MTLDPRESVHDLPQGSLAMDVGRAGSGMMVVFPVVVAREVEGGDFLASQGIAVNSLSLTLV